MSPFLSFHSSFGTRGRPVLAMLGLALAGILAVRHWVWMPVLISGQSMLPTLRDGQILGLNKLAYLFHPPRRGDIVMIWTGQEYMTKRVLGLPGEEMAVHNGEFYLNGNKLREPYVRLPRYRHEIGPGTIESGCFVIAGDNRCPEAVIAVVRADRIIGRIIDLGHDTPTN